MKFIYLFLLLFCYAVVYSQPTTVCAATTTGQVCSSVDLGDLTPCSKANFIVNYMLPSGYNFASKYEWYANGVLVKTVNASTSNDNVLTGYIINDNKTDLYCDVTFRKSDGTLSAPQRSQTFTVYAKALNFNSMTGPTSINVGDQNTVSYSIPQGSCNLCFTPTSYNVTWQYPSGWVQTGSSNNGLNASFTPDQVTGGTMIGTINLTYSGCSFKAQRTLNVTRVLPPVTMSGPSGICTSGNYMAGSFPSCGGNVTYSWTNSSNLNLSANGNSVTVSPVSGSSGAAWVEVTASSNCGTSTYRKNINIETPPSINGGYYTNAAPGFGNLSSGMNVICGLYSPCTITFDLQGVNALYSVNANGTPTTPAWSASGNTLDFDGFSEEGQTVTFNVSVSNSCSSSSYSYTFYQYNCENALTSTKLNMYPNPASSEVTINLKNINKAGSKTAFKEIKEVTILDKFGNVKKILKFSSGSQSATFNISNLPCDTYIVIVSDGIHKENLRLNKVK